MSVTDELRTSGVHMPFSDTRVFLNEELTAIADRIDAEHEAMLADARKAVYQDYVELPKDADGVPIRFGDKVTVSWKDEVYEVTGFSCIQQLASDVRTICVEVYSSNRMGNVTLCAANGCRHYKPPTVEDVMVEFATDWESAQDGEDKTAVLKEYAKRLTLAGDGE